MNKTIITRNVELDAKNINSNIKKNLFLTLKLNYEKICDERYGYIIKIIKIQSYTSNMISSVSGNPIFKVKFSAITLYPQIGKEYKTKVNLITDNYLYCYVKNILPILVSRRVIINNEQIEIGDELKVKIKNFQFSNKKFFCIGTIK